MGGNRAVREEPGKQRPRSCRAQELARSGAQESGGRKGGCTGDQSESDERRRGAGALRRRQDRWLRCRLEELVLLWSATSGAESRNVAPHLGLVLQVPKSLAENAGRGLVFGRDKAVVHPLAFASRRNDSCSTEIGKMARDFRLADAQDFDKVADTNLSVGDKVQQA
jgi:hypothetical protein